MEGHHDRFVLTFCLSNRPMTEKKGKLHMQQIRLFDHLL